MEQLGGVVVAGSGPTAQAGAEVLRAGGNAVDAAVAACLATGVGEPSLTSLAGSGVMLYHAPDTGEVVIGDFNADAPGLGSSPPASLDFFPVELRFGPSLQVFHIGRAAAAVPGALPGLLTALEQWGRLPLSEVAQPACRLLREGVVVDDFQVECFKLLEPILMHSEESRRLFARDGRLLRRGERFQNPDLSDTLERLSGNDWRAVYRDELIPAILDSFGIRLGGLITRQDLDEYRVEFREPLRLSYRDCEVCVPPRPSAGGTLIKLALTLLGSEEIHKYAWGDPEHLRRLCAVMRTVEEARMSGGDPLSAVNLATYQKRFSQLLSAGGSPKAGSASPGSSFTTHISVIDGEGRVAAVTLSHGEGNGYLIGNTGITMNNMMGESDLHVQGFHAWPAGQRLNSMMSPTLVRRADGTLTVLGTGGSGRIRTAITQVVSNLADFNMDIAAAVRSRRIHWEPGVLNAEVHDLPGWQELLEPLLAGKDRLVPFDGPHLFFGGVHTAQRTPDGSLYGAGDRRRSGVVAEA
jgi:gamma-glutamyltranspeptidase/glutathione hydrolase